jgi:membrane protein
VTAAVRRRADASYSKAANTPGPSPEIAALPAWLARCVPRWLHLSRDRGETADAPTAIPAAGWIDIAIRTVRAMLDHNVPTLAAGVTFYAMLSFIPTLSAVAAAYGLFAHPVTGLLQGVAPNETFSLIRAELNRIGSQPQSHLGWILGIGLVAGMGALKAALMALMSGLNVAYGEEECRSFLRRTLIAAGLTAGVFVLLPLVLTSLLVGRGLLGEIELPAAAIGGVRFCFLAAVTGLSLALLYRYAPCRKAARWRWVTPGGLLAAVMWLGCSAGLSFYITHFAHYQRNYGLLGAFMAVMVWLWVASAATLVGAELNAQLEAQTARDTAKD